ncbi:response regulator [Sphingomonas profundi]|uniref:phosphorylase family protein n=1 Tax=Alterirhizorhabdus profundi TaxID=2681549 RepID=UPI0012E76172|nr:response regulator [Sphingomonas profundi]
MIRILIVEDDAEKLRRVTKCLLGVEGLEPTMIEDARDATAAKRMMRDARYDLLVLDILIPSRRDEPPAQASGLELLREVIDRDVYHTPVHMVGLTANEEALAVARPRFDDDVLQVVLYDPSSTAWSERLARLAARALAQAKGAPPAPSHGVDVAVICALATPELAAVLDLPWDWSIRDVPGDPTTYHRGSFFRDGIRREVVAAAAPRMGMQASGVLAMKMVMTFRPRYLAMVGILAGVRGGCELGDIVVADPSWDYGSGKRSAREGAPAFASAPHQLGLDPFVRSRLARMAQDVELLDRIRRGWRGGSRDRLLSLRLGPVASGAAVLEDEEVVAQIRGQHRKTLGVEMETYGVFVAAEESPDPQPRCFSLKSVCDFADPAKDDGHQAYAAYTSAAAFRLFCEGLL